jgi:hypothetical protein
MPLGDQGFFRFTIKIKHTMAERSIVDIGKYLQRFGLRVGENPAFGGVGGGHSPTGYHPKGLAIDVTDWRPDVAPAYEGGKPIPWKQRTGELSWRAKQLGTFNEALGPGDPGHDTHVHLALEGKKYLTDQQLEWLATGRYKTPEGKLTDAMPTATQPVSSENPGSVNTAATNASLFGALLNALQPKKKTIQETLTESLFASALSPQRTPSMLQQMMYSGPMDEIIYG